MIEPKGEWLPDDQNMATFEAPAWPPALSHYAPWEFAVVWETLIWASGEDVPEREH